MRDKTPLSDAERLELLRSVYDHVYCSTESFLAPDHVGPDLAYLLGAIADGMSFSGCRFPRPCRLIEILAERFPAGHVVWEYVEYGEDG